MKNQLRTTALMPRLTGALRVGVAFGLLSLAGCGNKGAQSGAQGGQLLPDSSMRPASLRPTRTGTRTGGTRTGGTRTSGTASGSGQMLNPDAPLLPDPRLTPGDALDVTPADFCVSGYSKKVRNVPASVKKQVYALYGITQRGKGEFEVDHLISLELGGSNSVKNLWPQSFLTKDWNAHTKDDLENKLHEMICAKQIDYKTAQQMIATDWIAAYKKVFNTNVPLGKSRTASTGSDEVDTGTGATGGMTNSGGTGGAVGDMGQGAQGRGNTGQGDQGTSGLAQGGQVWVNTKSGKFFHEGSSHYGKTKQGQYMSEAQAVQQGYTAAQGN